MKTIATPARMPAFQAPSDEFSMEINPLRNQLDDIRQRTDALRGYL